MTHITKEKATELDDSLEYEIEKHSDFIHALCNAAIEWHIAQQAASVDATFKKWNTPILDKYAPMQHEPENEPSVSLASQAAPKEPKV